MPSLPLVGVPALSLSKCRSYDLLSETLPIRRPSAGGCWAKPGAESKGPLPKRWPYMLYRVLDFKKAVDTPSTSRILRGSPNDVGVVSAEGGR